MRNVVRYDTRVVIEQDGDGETLRLWKRLWALSFGLNARSKQMAATIGVTGEERLVIRFIAQCPNSTPHMLARSLNVDARTIVRLLRRLEKRGFVAYRNGSRGGTLPRLTPRGFSIAGERRGTVEAAVFRTLERLDTREIAGSAELLELLAGELRSE